MQTSLRECQQSTKGINMERLTLDATMLLFEITQSEVHAEPVATVVMRWSIHRPLAT